MSLPSSPPTSPPASAPDTSFSVALTWLVAGASFMENLDGTIIGSALPKMAVTLGTTALNMNLGVSAYLLAVAVALPLSGWLSDRFGSRMIFSLAVLIFTLSSVACAASDSLPAFALARVVQGVGGAMMVPVGRLVVFRNTPKHLLIDVIAALTWPALIAPVIGPALGGFITDSLNWRWIFWLNLPLGAAALLATQRWLPDLKTRVSRFDWIGFVLFGGAILLTMTAMECVAAATFNAWALVGSATIAALIGSLAVRHFLTSRNPMIALSSFSVPTFRMTVLGGSLFRMAISAIPFLLPLMLQLDFGMSAFHSGLLVLSVFAGNLAMKPFTTLIIRRYRFKTVLLVNGLIMVLSVFACAFFVPGTSIGLMAAVLFIGGLSRSMQFTTINTLAFCDVSEPMMKDANTLFSLLTQISMGLGVTLGAAALGLSALLVKVAAPAPLAAHQIAFVLVGLLALVSLADTLPLQSNAGDNLLVRQ